MTRADQQKMWTLAKLETILNQMKWYELNPYAISNVEQAIAILKMPHTY